MPNTKQEIAKKVETLVEPVLGSLDMELVDVVYLSQHGRWILRLFIDKEGGVTIEDCVHVSREIGDLIDVKDVISHEYTLEVSSPGLDRPLKKDKDFIRVIGEKIKVSVLQPVLGRSHFTGRLSAFQDDVLYLEEEQGRVALPLADVSKAHLVYEFKDLSKLTGVKAS